MAPLISSFSRIKSAVIFNDCRPPVGLPNFQKRNLIYGFNGSGKTTLTRILASLAEGVRDPRLPTSAEFSVKLDDGTVITQSSNLGG